MVLGWHNMIGLVVALGFVAAFAACLLASRPMTRRSALLACCAMLVSGILAVLLAWGGAAGRSPLWLVLVVLIVCALIYLAALAIMVVVAMTTTDYAALRLQRLARLSTFGVFASLFGLLLFAVWSSGD